MNKSRFDSIYEGLSTVAKKVYEAVPINDGWTPREIQLELSRTGAGVTRDIHVFKGCIESLVRSGIVSESRDGKLRRVKVAKPDVDERPPIESFQRQIQETPMAKQDTKPLTIVPKKLTPIERLAGLSARCSKLMEELRALASDIETAAIEIDEQTAAAEEGAKKLAQLQALLKGIAE